jgi:hypothetical protein
MKNLSRVLLFAVLLGALGIQGLLGDAQEKSQTERLWEQKKIVQEELDRLESLTTTVLTSIEGIFKVDRAPWMRLRENIEVMKKALKAIDGHLAEIEADYSANAPGLNFDLSGEWHDGYSPCRIEQTGETLEVWINTSTKSRGPFSGRYTGQNTIKVDFTDDPNKACCSGTIADNNTINWDNGFTWTRK